MTRGPDVFRRHARFFRAKLGRRIVLLFFACAVLPVAGFSLISFRHVTGQLEEQSRERLRAVSKELGMSMLQRLQLAEAELERLAAAARIGGREALEAPPAGTSSAFRRLALGPDSLSTEEREHLRAGGSVVLVRPGDGAPTVRIGRRLDPGDPSRGLVWGELDLSRLWGAVGSHRTHEPSSTLPAGTRLCVWTEAGGWPDCPGGLVRALREAGPAGAAGAIEWVGEGTAYLAGRWGLHLTASFRTSPWTVVLSESREDVLAPLTSFRRTVLLSLALALLVVLFLSQVQIRRNLEPLEKLKEGTRRIARREFDSRVELTSGDEFEELAGAFNAMADRLGRQFGALLTTSEIDRGILGSLDTGRIVDTVLRRGPDVVPGARVVLTLLDPDGSGTGWAFHRDEDGGRRRERVRVSAAEASELAARRRGLVAGADSAPGLPGQLRSAGMGPWLVLPVFLEEGLAGTLAFAAGGRPVEDEDAAHGRRLADHLAVALANARLVDELDRLNLQTLAAFARAIDAKSAWTAGHSERVTAVAVAIGEALGLDREEREVLRRGALLHDVGKIGVPGAILDKPGPLTEREMEIMRSHTEVGARIVQPIARFERLVPIVRHHHERFDGGGYPDRIAGEAIDPLARIAAVADVYDALTSARPYRPAHPPEAAIEFIRTRRGTAFDPAVVDAFLRAAPALAGARGDGRRPPELEMVAEPADAALEEAELGEGTLEEAALGEGTLEEAEAPATAGGDS